MPRPGPTSTADPAEDAGLTAAMAFRFASTDLATSRLDRTFVLNVVAAVVAVGLVWLSRHDVGDEEASERSGSAADGSR